MRKLVFLFLFLSGQYLFANMASPIIPGTMMATPFTSQYVDILGEKIFIQINDGFSTAKFQIQYRIRSSAIGKQIPFIFYAVDYSKDFKVWIDGKEVLVKKLPDELKLRDSLLYTDFHYLFVKENNETNIDQPLSIKEGLQFNQYISVYDLLFFETDITEGEHLIKVEYEAVSEIDGSSWVNNYNFRYSLSPAKYWKSFGLLEVTIDASNFNEEITTNLGALKSGNLDEVSNWSFTQLPDDFILIEYKPQISSFAQTLINISPEGIALIFGFLLIVFHLVLIIKYRNKNLELQFSKVVIIGSLLVPLFYVIINFYAYDFIDSFIDHASGNHGYIFLIIFFYPILLPFYWVIMWLVDRLYKRNLIRKKSTTF